MQVHVDTSRCQGHALCAMTAPELFDLNDDDGHATAVVGTVSTELKPKPGPPKPVVPNEQRSSRRQEATPAESRPLLTGPWRSGEQWGRESEGILELARCRRDDRGARARRVYMPAPHGLRRTVSRPRTSVQVPNSRWQWASVLVPALVGRLACSRPAVRHA
ncbi:ferredoxin [Streptomyces sp. KL116D]|uniref:ferredoxin n=1 Tax=Streptomyces sp. KL116D TaxID=3045152 RepID=UPI00355932D4